MGWCDYDPKIGRFLVADEYNGEDSNPISFNRYLYAESDPVNNIDPDGYAPKWLKKIAKGIKKAAKSSYNLVLGDDIRTLTSKNTKWYQKVVAGALIASNFVPGVGTAASVTAKVAVKGTVATVKDVKATTSAKKAAAVVNKTPKTVAAKSIKSTPKIDESKIVKVNDAARFTQLSATDYSSKFIPTSKYINDGSMNKITKGTNEGLYSNISDSKSVGEGKKFTPTQKQKIIEENMKRNGGKIKSDLSGEELVPAKKSVKGVKPPQNEVQIDHIEPRSKGGSNSYRNAQVTSRKENRDKWDK